MKDLLEVNEDLKLLNEVIFIEAYEQMSSKHIKYKCKDCLYQAHYRVDYDKHMTLKYKKDTVKDFI